MEQSQKTNREELLLKMYDQLWQSINTHLLVVWQSIGVLISTFAIFALVEKNVIPIDYATAIVVLSTGWLIAHVYDASYWYNRNLAIIGNIEKLFLKHSDLKNVHFYFGKHKDHKPITHFIIQIYFGIGIASIFLVYHFLTSVMGNYSEVENYIPYVFLIVVIGLLVRLRNKRKDDYELFLEDSPGINL